MKTEAATGRSTMMPITSQRWGSSSPEQGCAARRGFAMFLVILALGVGVVLAGVALSSRSTAPRIGAHVHEMSSAQWVAESAARYAEAVLQTSAEWRGKLGADGLLISDLEIGPGLADVTIRSADGSSLEITEREILVIAVGRVGSMEATVERQVSLTPNVPVEEAVGLELAEFGIAAASTITIEDDAVVGIYPFSPDASAPYPVRLGAFFTSSGGLDVSKKAKLSNTAVALDARASSALSTTADNTRYARKVALPFNIPLQQEQLPSSMASLPTAYLFDTTISGGSFTLPEEGARKKWTVTTGGTLVIDASKGTRYSFDELILQNGGVLRIKGRVFIHVKGVLTIQSRARMEYADAASSVVFFTGSTVTINDAVIGLDSTIAANSSRTPSLIKSYIAPARCRILALNSGSGGSSTPTFQLLNKAMVVASLHNPTGTVDVREDCALIGRATAMNIRMRQRATLWYDPAMDTRVGYAVLNGPLYSAGALLPSMTSAMAGFKSTTGVSDAGVQLAQAARSDLSKDPKWSALVSSDANADSEGLLTPIITTTTSLVSKTLDILTGGGDTTEQAITSSSTVITSEKSTRSAAKTRTERVPGQAKKLENNY